MQQLWNASPARKSTTSTARNARHAQEVSAPTNCNASCATLASTWTPRKNVKTAWATSAKTTAHAQPVVASTTSTPQTISVRPVPAQWPKTRRLAPLAKLKITSTKLKLNARLALEPSAMTNSHANLAEKPLTLGSILRPANANLVLERETPTSVPARPVKMASISTAKQINA